MIHEDLNYTSLLRFEKWECAKANNNACIAVAPAQVLERGVTARADTHLSHHKQN